MKTKIKNPLALLFVLMLTGSVFFIISCESSKPNTSELDSVGAELGDAHGDLPTPDSERQNGLALTPTSANITYIGQSQVFTVVGGDAPFSWAVTSSANGTISVIGFSQARYTSTTLGQNTVRVTDAKGHQASVPLNSPAMQMTPTTVAFAGATNVPFVASSAGFTVTGGTPPYTWSNGSVTLGTLTASGSSASYTMLAVPGQNIITVVDAVGQTLTAAITQTAN